MSKVTIQGDASGTGIFTIASPNSNTDRTLVLPDEAGTIDTLQRTGNVLQVLSATKTDTSSTTGPTWSDTGLSVSITPTSASSKFLFSAFLMAASEVGDGFYIRLVRDGTVIGIGDAAGSRLQVTFGSETFGTSYIAETVCVQYMDTPSTTSEIVYKVQFAGQLSDTTVYLNRSHQDTDSAVWPRGISTITVMEIAG